MEQPINPQEHSFSYYVPNNTTTPDLIRENYRIEYLAHNQKQEFVDRYVNGTSVSTTVTIFVNGYKHGAQHILKNNGNGSLQTFTNFYDYGVLISSSPSYI